MTHPGSPELGDPRLLGYRPPLVRVEAATRGVAVDEPTIPAKRYDGFALLALIQQQPADGDQQCAAGAQSQRGQPLRQHEGCEYQHTAGERRHHEC